MAEEMRLHSDGRHYSLEDKVNVGCHDCSGCTDCCRTTGDSIILNPRDMFYLTIGLEKKFEDTIEKEIEIRLVDGLILPNIMETDEKHPELPEGCRFLTPEGRCGIHSFRPDLCRLFPVARVYQNDVESDKDVNQDGGMSSSRGGSRDGNNIDASQYGGKERNKYVSKAVNVYGSKNGSKNNGRNGEKGSHYYMVQVDQCSKPYAEHYPVRLQEWIGIPDREKKAYTEFVQTWHDFCRITGPKTYILSEKLANQVRNYILHVFFVMPWNKGQAFYPQFYARLDKVRRELNLRI